jgi:hypothetical protein
MFDFDDMVSSAPQHEHDYFRKQKRTCSTDGKYRLFIELSGRQPSEEGIVRESERHNQ